MPLPLTALPLVVASGSLVSSPFAVAGYDFIAVRMPAVTSCAAFLQVAADTTSASFTRAYDAQGSVTWALGAGPAAYVNRSLAGGSFPYARVELSVAQTDNRSLSIYMR